MREVDYEALKLGDIVMVEAVLKKYPRKANGQKRRRGLSASRWRLMWLRSCMRAPFKNMRYSVRKKKP